MNESIMYSFIASLFKFFISLFIPKYFRNLFTHYLILNKEIEILKRQQKKRITFTHVDSLQLKNENIFWGCRKISNEMRKIGIEIDKVTIWRILKHYRKQGLDHFLLFNKNQVYGIIKKYIEYYKTKRPHQGLDGNVPRSYKVQKERRIKSEKILFGLHHHYYREAA